MSRLRNLVPALASAAVATVAPVPAAASPTDLVGIFAGTAHLPCFGCGPRDDGTFDGTFTGIAFGSVRVESPVSAQFAYDEPPATCPLTGTATGIFTIDHDVDGVFSWTRIGDTAVITLTRPDGHGMATFHAPPLACGGPVEAGVEGWVVSS